MLSCYLHFAGVYLTCTMAITTLAMVATVFVLNLYGMKEKPVPPWAKTLFTVYLARFLCMCNCAETPETRRDDSEYNVHARATNPLHHNKHQREQPILKRNSADMIPWRSRGSEAEPLRRPSSTPTGLTFVPIHQQNFDKNGENKPDYNKDWIHVAAVFDRLFFWLCLIFIVVTTLLLFHPLTTSRFFELPALDKNKEQITNRRR